MAQNQFLIIKPNILQDKDLTSTDKLILAYIIGFLNNGNVFYASNKEISDFLGISKRQVIRSISKLSELGYFTIRHSKEKNIPGNDIRVLERSEKYLELFTTFEKIIGSYKSK